MKLKELYKFLKFDFLLTAHFKSTTPKTPEKRSGICLKLTNEAPEQYH